MGQRIDDGFPTLIEFSASPVMGLRLWEKTVTPPGMDGGGPNDTTTMRNERWRTKQPKKLLTLTSMSCEMAYDPESYDDLKDMMQVNQQLTVHFADGSGVRIWGWLDKFEPNEVSEGEQPTAEVVIEPSNQNNSGVEVGPEYLADSSS